MTTIAVNEDYQSGYSYRLDEPTGKNFREDFKPDLTPKEMFHLGIFGGDYFISAPKEFPNDWFEGVTFSRHNRADKTLNFYKTNASMPQKYWEQKGWMYPEDPKGWVLWYCRYYYGRRIPEEDDRQIRRWKNMKRHITQLQAHCKIGDLECRKRQRQSLLHWAYDSRKL